MSVRINLGSWGSIFALPTDVVDKHIKIASPLQLKVLLYLLRNSEKSYTYQQLAEFFSVHKDDIADCVSFWVERNLLINADGELLPIMSESQGQSQTVTELPKEEKPDVKFVQPRLTKPDIITAAQRVSADVSLQHLLSEVEVALAKPLSSGDTATVIMLYDSCGLPADVILMLVHYCVSVDKGNIRAIERIGVKWANEGINCIEAADNKIKQAKLSTKNWNTIKGVFGIGNVGSPTPKQLEYADKWISVWHFSNEMLRKAYEVCVDTTGKMSLPYINKVLQRWYNAGVFNVDDIDKLDAKKPSNNSKSKASYDIDELEKIN